MHYLFVGFIFDMQYLFVGFIFDKLALPHEHMF